LGDFLMTYDNAPQVQKMARRQGFATAVVPMKNTHHAVMSALLIGRNLQSVRRQAPVTELPTINSAIFRVNGQFPLPPPSIVS
jgi:hypothetical protein